MSLKTRTFAYYNNKVNTLFQRMKFVLSSSVLASRLQTIGRVIVQKNNVPILDCFCFDIKGNVLTITASDNDSTLFTKIELSESDADIRFAINAKTIQDAIKEIPDQPLEIYLNPETYELTIQYQNGHYKITGQDATTYPMTVVNEEKALEITLKEDVFLAAINRSLVAVANDGLRPQLNSICLDIQDHSVSVVSSNGGQLALTSIPYPSIDTVESYLLGTRPTVLLKGMLSKGDGEVRLSLSERTATISNDNYSIICRLVEGRFPAYRKIIPENNPNVITINRMALISAIRRMLVTANAQNVLVKFRIDVNSLYISSQDIDFGKSAEESVLCEYVGTPMRIAFKGSDFLELINNINSEEVQIKLSDPSRAGLIVPKEEASDNGEEANKVHEKIVMLIMPSIFND